jgi:hypothetical protein
MIVLGVMLAATAQPSVVSDLHTVSIHVDSVETYNTIFQLLSGAFRWPVIYGKPLAAEQKDRRNFAGIWAGNVRLEICGPYPNEFAAQDVRARLHGLTFCPYDDTKKSAAELDKLAILHRIPSWGRPELLFRFVTIDDPAMTAQLFSISIMQVVKRGGKIPEHDSSQQRLIENRGGPLGLKRAREFRIAYPDDAALRKWQQLLGIDGDWWPGAGGAALRFVKSDGQGIQAAVLEVESAENCTRALRDIGVPAVRVSDPVVEYKFGGVRLLFAEVAGSRTAR